MTPSPTIRCAAFLLVVPFTIFIVFLVWHHRLDTWPSVLGSLDGLLPQPSVACMWQVLVASDAVGMGLNLNIRRIIFHSLNKFEGAPAAWIVHLLPG